MSEAKHGTPTFQTSSEERPAWWTPHLEAGWDCLQKIADDEWDQGSPPAAAMRKALVEEAMAFGYWARRTYPQSQAWNPLIAARLESAWAAGHGEAQPWRQVAEAVRHGWKRGAPRPPISTPMKKAKPRANQETRGLRTEDRSSSAG
jgi:hypothetical protein